MDIELVKRLVNRIARDRVVQEDKTQTMFPPLPVRVDNKGLSYTARHRGMWNRPEYDFEEISIAQDTDSDLSRSIQKKVNKVIVAGFDFVGHNSESVQYIKRRVAEMGYATGAPWEQLIWTTFADLFRFSNCMWVKARDIDSSSGDPVELENDQILKPIAGYFILPFEALELKVKVNGELKKVKLRIDTREKEFSARDVIHFYTNRKPGFVVGTPEILPALDDIALLRRIEENVEDLIETNLFPVFHYKIGTDNMPARVSNSTGLSEEEAVRRTIQYMPANAIYVSDHRHVIEAIGSEGRALRIDFYLTYFRNRVLSGLGTSALDLGQGGDANKSTASTLSKGLLMDVEAMTKIVKSFLEFHVITELLIEGGYNPLDPDDMVFIKFGAIDKDDRRADENQQMQLYHGNLRTMDEVRASLGDDPWTEDHLENSYYKMFEEPLALLNGMGAGSAASETLAAHPSSNVSPAAVAKEKNFAEKTLNKQLAAKKATGRPKTSSKAKSARASSSNKAKPANQHGSRSSPKTNRDIFDSILETCDFVYDADKVEAWKTAVLKQHETFNNSVSLESIAYATIWRIRSN